MSICYRKSYYKANFSSLDAVRRLAGEMQGDQEQFDVLINKREVKDDEVEELVL